MQYGDLIDISEFEITNHASKRWRKRWLDYTPPAGEKRIRTLEQIIQTPMTIIRQYLDRSTVRVTDYKYELVVDIERKIIITINAYGNLPAKKDMTKIKKKRRMKKCYNTTNYAEEY